MTLPRASEPFVRFAQALRDTGMPVSPDQTIGFIESVGLLGPRDMTDIFRAGKALFAVPPERFAEYEAIFRAVFLDQMIKAPADGEDEDDVEAYEPTGTDQQIEVEDDTSEVGQDPVTVERLSQRNLSGRDDDALRTLMRDAPSRLPRRLSYRFRRSNHGTRIDMRRTLRDAARRDGEALQLLETRRSTRQRRVLLLIDVSGSMSDRTEGLLSLAHTVVQSADRAEVFTLGTRLTRITSAMRSTDRSVALKRASSIVADIDGGTRLGEALEAFLDVPRYSSFARGAAVVLLSDGLERGSPEIMINAISRLSRSAWRLDLLTPLAADPDFEPATSGLLGILPVLDHLGDGAELTAISDHILNMANIK
ncbi:MAG: VWA domain-containing protein [Paracoccaceae bacterium]